MPCCFRSCTFRRCVQGGPVKTVMATSLSDEHYVVCHQKLSTCQEDAVYGRKVSSGHATCACSNDEHWYPGAIDKNIARGKPTSQVSEYSSGVSSRAVDGETSSAYTSGSCTHTKVCKRSNFSPDGYSDYHKGWYVSCYLVLGGSS